MEMPIEVRQRVQFHEIGGCKTRSIYSISRHSDMISIKIPCFPNKMWFDWKPIVCNSCNICVKRGPLQMNDLISLFQICPFILIIQIKGNNVVDKITNCEKDLHLMIKLFWSMGVIAILGKPYLPNLFPFSKPKTCTNKHLIFPLAHYFSLCNFYSANNQMETQVLSLRL